MGDVATEVGGPKIITELPGPKARAYLEQSRTHEPNSMSEQAPLVWDRAEGVIIQDVDGNQFLDFCSGVLVANIGHSHPDYVAAVQDQVAALCNCYDFVSPHRADLAQKLVEITPDYLDKAFILTTGAEATEAALKMARRAHEGYEIVAFHGAFHGRTYGAMSVAGSMGPKKGFGPMLSSVIHAPFCYCYRCPFDKRHPDCQLHCLDYLDYAVGRESAGALCVLITEPYQGGAGSIVPPPGYMERLFDWVKSRGMHFILDEVQSSFGRTGTMFALEHWDIEPDLVCLGKGLGSGIPCSAVVGRSEIMDILQPGELGSTNGGNPVSARAALTAIDIIERERLVENSAKLGRLIMDELDRLRADVEQIGDVRGMGLAIGVEMVADEASRAPAPELTRRVVEEAFQRGLCMIAPIGMHGNVIRIAPPLVITERQVRVGLEILEAAVRAAVG